MVAKGEDNKGEDRKTAEPEWAGILLEWLKFWLWPQKFARNGEWFFAALFLLAFLFLVTSISFLATKGTLLFGNELLPSNRDVKNWDDFRNLTFGVAGAVGAVFGLFQLYNSAVRTRLNDRDTQTRTIDANTNVEQERNERFVRASELLAHEDAAVRMAGVFALERLAKEPGAEYTSIVTDVISGFVRERTNRPKYPARPDHEYLPALEPQDTPYNRPQEEEKEEEEEEERGRHNTGGWGKPNEPVKAAVTALNKICAAETKADRTPPLVDLSDAQLPRLEAPDFHCRDWIMDHANLQGAWLHRANLQGARLYDANLQDAWLNRANLQGAWLNRANLQGAQLYDANLQGAYLNNANLQGAQLNGTNLHGAWLKHVSNLTLDQCAAAIWPVKTPPRLPENIDTNDPQLDKRWCTDDADPNRLHPDLFDKDGDYRAAPPGFRERRELGIAPYDDGPQKDDKTG